MATTNGNVPSKSIGDDVYDGLGGVGRFMTKLSLVVTIIAGLVLLVLGIYFVATDDDDKKYLKVKGTIIEPNCVSYVSSYDKNKNPVNMYKCNIVVTYNIEGKDFEKKLFVDSNKNYVKGEPVDLQVDKSNYENAKIAEMNKTYLGVILIIVAIVAGALSYLNYYLADKYKVYAAGQGASTIFNIFR